MIELLFVVCLTAQPDSCSERSLAFVGISPLRCVSGAPPELARWAEAHPAYRIARWRCRDLGSETDA